MKRIPALCGVVSFAVLLSAAQAEESQSLQPKLLKPEKQTVAESFDAGKLPADWKVMKGSWEVTDGKLVAREKAADEHAGVLNLPIANQDSAIEVSFTFEGAKAFHLSLNHAKGHLFRVILNPNSVVLRTDKDKKDPASKSELLGKAETTFEAGKQYTLLLEMRGDEVQVQVNNGVTLYGKHPGLKVEKPGYRFIIQGEAVQLDDIKIWQPGS